MAQCASIHWPTALITANVVGETSNSYGSAVIRKSEGDPDPLIILDGNEITKQEMEAVNVESISSIDVLKDKSATRIYGDKGKDGVIIITLKKSVDNNLIDENQQYKDCSVSVCHKSKPGEYIWEVKDFTLKEFREEFRKLPVIEDMVVVTSFPNDIKPEMVDALKNTLRKERALKVNMKTKSAE